MLACSVQSVGMNQPLWARLVGGLMLFFVLAACSSNNPSPADAPSDDCLLLAGGDCAVERDFVSDEFVEDYPGGY